MQNQSVDIQKRRTMAIIAGTGAALALPSLASAGQPIQPHKSDVTLDSGNPNVEIVLSLDNSPTIFIRNNTEKVVIIKHVYPGVVHANGKTFDINSLFERSATAVAANHTRRLPIEEISPLAKERAFPKGLIGSKPVRMVKADQHGLSNEVTIAHRNYFFA